jgi:predicted Rossmann fold flavoprotein
MHEFGVKDIISFCNNNGLKTITERGNRVFPENGNADDVLNLFLKVLKELNIVISANSRVTKIVQKDSHVEKILLGKNQIFADNFIICTGGMSYPKTGSDGDGFKWAKSLGHTVTTTQPALVPVLIKEDWINELEGLILKNINVSVFNEEKKIDQRFGEASFCKNGMDGPVILDMSKNISNYLNSDKLIIKIDLKPALDHDKLDKRIQRDFLKFKNKDFQNSLNDLLPKKMISIFIKLSGISPLKKVHSITKAERKKLLSLFKEFKLNIKGIKGFDRAIITSGGIKLDEINPKNMKSRILKNLYFAGEILDIDGPTGGYNLQVCWSTGYLAGISK